MTSTARVAQESILDVDFALTCIIPAVFLTAIFTALVSFCVFKRCQTSTRGQNKSELDSQTRNCTRTNGNAYAAFTKNLKDDINSQLSEQRELEIDKVVACPLDDDHVKSNFGAQLYESRFCSSQETDL